jgi:hypothetical protein
MFDRIADRLHRQEVDVQTSRYRLADPRDNTFRDNRIRLEWQVRAMLFVCAKGQDDNHIAVLIAQFRHVFLTLLIGP